MMIENEDNIPSANSEENYTHMSMGSLGLLVYPGIFEDD